ncbi:MAG: alanine racemase [Pirellulales bacterium]|nr:alanine racemase [Pirellulales bacterium]
MQSYVTVETSAEAVRHNLRLLRGCIQPGVKLCLPVKADCYGHGLELLMNILCLKQDTSLPPVGTPLVDSLAVAAPEEAVRVRELGCELPLLSFFSAAAYLEGPVRDEALSEMIARDVIQTVVSVDEIEPIAQVALRLGRAAEVHIKIDSGMGRSGVLAKEAVELFGRIRRQDGLRLTGLCSHFATSDEADTSFMHRQLDSFKQVLAACGDTEGMTIHMANSAATIDLPEAHFNMVRPGLAAYGYQPSQYLRNRQPLRPALRATTRLMPIKEVPAGTSCGYGLTYTFDKPGRISRVAMGYGDGYLRCLSNKSTVRVHGVDVPVRGRVSMDQLIIDLTDVPQARMGDEVELISPDPTAPHSVENLALLAGTIPHEIVCLLAGRITRILVD